ncbi:hypothetical protein L6164_008468 [Bauhinia variegata]|uniref:Uncharacterized protein n=1 Tax=Bauhinia variegata TaxID=167791 RepID=A0ACB9PH27_BAUVA|nr:hypothetical protein L6164_008468 [Bauhinia variegata]
MAKNPSKLAEVDYSSETWKLTVRVTSMWKVFKFGKMQSLDMVFMDEDILASIHHSIVEKFKHLLEEGKTYMMTNFEVLEDDQQLRVSKLPYKLKFVRTITIRECVLANIPLHAFLFTPFEEILSEKAPSNVLYSQSSQIIDDEIFLKNAPVKAMFELQHFKEAEVTNFNEFPQAIDDLAGKICAFKIKPHISGATSSGQEISFSILELKDTKDLVDALWDKVEHIKTSMLVDNQSQEGSIGFVTPSKRLWTSFLDDDAINLSFGICLRPNAINRNLLNEVTCE